MAESQLKVSLITTVFNESGNINKFICSILQQSRQPDEIVIVDAGSTDGTLQIVRELFSGSKIPQKIIIKTGCNIAEGRNIAIASASYEIIAVADGGTVLDKDWLYWLIKPFEEDRTRNIVGGFYVPIMKNNFQKAVCHAYLWSPDINEDSFLPSSRSVALTKTAWKDVNGYPEWLDFGEDTFFDLALEKKGYQFHFARQAIVHWELRDTVGKTVQQFYRYSRGDGRALQLFREVYLPYHLIRFGLRLVTIVLSVFNAYILLLTLADVIYFTMRYRIKKMFNTNESIITKIQCSCILMFLAPLLDTALQTGYVAGIYSTFSTKSRDRISTKNK